MRLRGASSVAAVGDRALRHSDADEASRSRVLEDTPIEWPVFGRLRRANTCQGSVQRFMGLLSITTPPSQRVWPRLEDRRTCAEVLQVAISWPDDGWRGA